MCFMYTLAVTLLPLILYTVTHSLPPYAFFLQPLFFNAVLYKLCVCVCVSVCERACVCVCTYLMLFLNVYELICEHVSSCVALHEPPPPPELESRPSFSIRMVVFIAVVVLCGSRW